MTENKWDKLSNLAKSELGEESELVAVITWNSVLKTATCYGRHVEDGAIFKVLNLSTGEPIRRRTRKQFKGAHEGLFVCLGKFEEKAKSPQWAVALVNIPDAPEELSAVSFKL